MTKIGSSEDFAATRERWQQGDALSRITNSDNVEHIVLGGQDIAVLLSGEDTAGQMAIFELVAEPGANAAQHHQTTENEYWYIVKGEWEVQTGDTIATVGPGNMVLVPQDATHAFKLVSDKPGKMLVINAPAGHELFFQDAADQRAAGIPRPEMLKSMTRFNVVFED